MELLDQPVDILIPSFDGSIQICVQASILADFGQKILLICKQVIVGMTQHYELNVSSMLYDVKEIKDLKACFEGKLILDSSLRLPSRSFRASIESFETYVKLMSFKVLRASLSLSQRRLSLLFVSEPMLPSPCKLVPTLGKSLRACMCFEPHSSLSIV